MGVIIHSWIKDKNNKIQGILEEYIDKFNIRISKEEFNEFLDFLQSISYTGKSRLYKSLASFRAIAQNYGMIIANRLRELVCEAVCYAGAKRHPDQL